MGLRAANMLPGTFFFFFFNNSLQGIPEKKQILPHCVYSQIFLSHTDAGGNCSKAKPFIALFLHSSCFSTQKGVTRLNQIQENPHQLAVQGIPPLGEVLLWEQMRSLTGVRAAVRLKL